MSFKRKRQEKQRLEKLYNETKNSFMAGCYWDEKKGRYIKYSYNSKWYKRYCAKQTRRKLNRVDHTYVGCSYKKLIMYKNMII